MSAGMDFTAAIAAGAVPQVTSALGFLAPRFRVAVEAALAECERAGLEAIVYETYRSDELQQLYYARGRTVKPPDYTVTNASSNLYSWHGYGLAVDVIHRKLRWKVARSWYVDVAEIFKRHGCKWGGDWKTVDLPHFQWGKCKATPSDRARELIRVGGLEAVWRAAGAAA